MTTAKETASTEYRDRSTGLVVFGIVEILVGVGCALLVPLILLSSIATRSLGGPGAAPDLRGTLPQMLLYAVFAVVFGCLGYGSIRARKWAREILLGLSWLWLITGVLTLLVSPWLLRAVAGLVAASPVGSPAVAVVAQIFVAVALLVGGVLLPGAMVLFYRSEDVAATCRALDRVPSWVDDCPPHILTLAMIFALGAVSVLAVPAYGFVLPFFGVVLNGFAGVVGWGLILVLLIWLTLRTVDRDPRAWWVAVAATVFATAATAVCFAVFPYAEIVDRMELPPDQRILLEAMAMPKIAMIVAALLTWGSLLGYLLYVKRFFGTMEDARGR